LETTALSILKNTHRSVRPAATSAILILLACLPVAQTASAADAEFVGVLALAVEDDAADLLGLTEQTTAALEKLVDERESKALELALQIKDLPPDQRKARLAPFAAESERLGFELLTEAQHTKLQQIRIARTGAVSLAEVKIAEQLQLTDEQKTQIAELIKKRDSDMAQGSEQQRRIAKAYYDRKLMSLLSQTQRAQWEKMAGLAAANGEQTADADGATKPGDGETTDDGDQKPPPPPTATERPDAAETPIPGPDAKLKFNFRYVPWKEVLDWFAQQAGLSLEFDSMPEGTFNYTDPRTYTPAEAIDLINSVLLTKGYTLVRRDRMLMLINLEDGIPPNLVSEVPLEDLDKRGEFELLSCLFQLTKMTSEEAEAEIRKLIGPQGSIVVLPKAKQIFVTETAGRLRTIRRIIQSIENPELASGEKLNVIPLKHVTAEEVLVVARQLLGLPEDQNAATDGSIRIAVDPLGTKLFVTGKAEPMARFDEILKLVDVPATFEIGEGGVVESPQLEVYSITAADPASVLQVMQTLMAGLPDVRLASDPKTGNLVAMARPSQHATIKATLDQMQRDARQIEVMRLRVVDPQLAVLSINKLFGAGEEGAERNAPVVDADPTTRQLLIRGTEAQIAQVRSLMEKMGEAETGTVDANETQRGNVRMLPITGRAARAALEQMELVWPTVRQNRIRVVTPSATIRTLRPRHEEGEKPLPPIDPTSPPKDAPKPETPKADPTKKETPPPPAPKAAGGGVPARFASDRRLLAQADEPKKEEPAKVPTETKRPDGKLPEIIVAPGPGGIMIASEDTEALDDFEALLTTLADRAMVGGRQYTVFYLKYAKAEVAADLLEEILGGGGGDAGGGGSLLGDIAGGMLGDAGGGLMGALLGMGGDGGAIETTGAVTVVPDTRLNALVVQANPTDLDTIEQLLEIIDQRASPEEVQTIARPRLIPVYYTSAVEVAEVVREVFAGSIASSGGGQQRQPSPEEFIRALRGGRGSSKSKSQREQVKMTIGIDRRSNSLVVSAPEALFRQVEELVVQLDQAGTEADQTTQVITLKRADPQVVQQALQSLVGQSVRTSTPSRTGTKTGSQSGSRTPSKSNGSQSSSAQQRAEAIRRMQMFQQMRQRSGGMPSPGSRPSGNTPYRRPGR